MELDERDRGVRRILNFGHTVGHAVEASSGYALPTANPWRSAWSRRRASPSGSTACRLPTLPRIASVIRAVGLPDRTPRGAWIWKRSAPGIARDKKKEGRNVHFVLIKKLGIPIMNGGVPEEILRETLEGMKP